MVGGFRGPYDFLANVLFQVCRMQLAKGKFEELLGADLRAGYFLTARSLRRFFSSDMNSWTSLKSMYTLAKRT